MLDFIANVVRSGKAKDWFEGPNLSGLISNVFSWVQMTSDDVSSYSRGSTVLEANTTIQEEEWVNNANAFVAQESDDTLFYSVRMAGFDLLAVSQSTRWLYNN